MGQGAFTAGGQFAPVDLQEGRFDSTPDYDKLPHLPLAWIGVFERQGGKGLGSSDGIAPL